MITWDWEFLMFMVNAFVAMLGERKTWESWMFLKKDFEQNNYSVWQAIKSVLCPKILRNQWTNFYLPMSLREGHKSIQPISCKRPKNRRIIYRFPSSQKNSITEIYINLSHTSCQLVSEKQYIKSQKNYIFAILI